MAEVAVIVPVYNAGAYLEKCIESIRNQTFEDLEICLIDDGSRDGSGDVCDAHAAADGRVRVVHQENAGLMAAWMRGVRETSAPYLFFSDADDYIDPDAIEVLARALSGEKKEVVIGALLTEKRNGKAEPEGCRAAAGVYEGEALRKLQAELLGNEVRALPFSRCMKLFSRALIEENMRLCEPRLRMAEDVNITLPVLLDAERIVVRKEAPFYHYRFQETSMAHAYDPGLFENLRLLRKVLTAVVEEKGMPGGAEAVDREYLCLLLLAVRNELYRERTEESAAGLLHIGREEDGLALLEKNPGLFTSGKNRLLAGLLRRPSLWRVRLLRALFVRK